MANLQIKFGDADRVFITEDADDKLQINLLAEQQLQVET